MKLCLWIPGYISHARLDKQSLRWSWWDTLKCVSLLGLVALPQATSATSLALSISPMALAGRDGQVEFVLLDGDFVTNNSATLTCLAPCPTPLAQTLHDPLGQYTQDFTPLGSQPLTFLVDVTTNFTASQGGTPDRLLVSLLDPRTSFTLVDTNLDQPDAAVPFQDALVVVDLLGGSVNIQIASLTNPPVGIQVVPEPSTLALLLLGIPLIAWRRVRRQRAA